MAFGDADRAAMLADFGVAVIYAAVTVKGIVDEVDEATLGGVIAPQVGRNKSVLVATGAISPTQGSSISVDGTTHTVYNVQEEPPDGRLLRVWAGELMASVKNRIADFVVSASCLDASSGKPSGLTVGRGKTTPMQLTGHPRVDVYVGDEVQRDLVGTKHSGNPVYRAFWLHCEIRVTGAIPDEALDPIEVWCEKQVMADERMGGIAAGVVGQQSQQDARQLDKNYALCTKSFLIGFTTYRANPELTGEGA